MRFMNNWLHGYMCKRLNGYSVYTTTSAVKQNHIICLHTHRLYKNEARGMRDLRDTCRGLLWNHKWFETKSEIEKGAETRDIRMEL